MNIKVKGLFWFGLIVAISFLMNTFGYAGNPVWTFATDPFYLPTLSIPPDGTATIQYVVTNQSRKTHTLVMTPIAGITQVTTAGNCPNPFILAYQQSCTLSLLVDGGRLENDVRGGPVVCQQGNALQCFQPSAANILNITRIPMAQYLINITVGANGNVLPDSSQSVKAGSNISFVATPNAGYHVDKWFVDGGIAQVGGASFSLSNIVANHSVEVTFTQAGVIYAGLANGSLHYSSDNGLNWSATTTPSAGASVNGVFVTSTMLYVGSADGKVYYSANNGLIWTATSSVPGGTAINSIFVATISGVPTMFVGTQNGNVYYSVDGIAWTATTIPGSGAVNSIFITALNTIYVGSGDGNVYYSTNLGSSWNVINGPALMGGAPIQNVFATNSQLYINTRHLSSDSTLPPGTVDFEYTYTSNSLTNPNPVWSLFSQITYTLFVNADASVIQAGTQDGYVFSLTTGDELGFITNSPVTSLFFLA